MDMAKDQSKKGLIVSTVVLSLVLLAVIGFVAFQNLNKKDTVETTNQTPSTSTPDDTANSTVKEDPVEKDRGSIQEVDESTLSSIDIEPLAITVFYTKGVPGFEYTVERTSDQTEYVQFTSPELVGTKCTDDKGAFASIVKNPTSAEDKTTIKETRTVGSSSYGLSLTAKNCTKDEALLEKYQTAFTNGFSRLKEL